MRFKSLLLIAVPLAIAPMAFAAGDAAEGRKKIAMCQGCHHIPGWKTAFPEVYHVPKIAGQHPAYIVAALKGYANGERTNETMRAIASQLSEKDMQDLAAFYAAPSAAAK